MPAHERVRAWTALNYQKPAIDQEWLADCADWVASELGLDPDRDFDQFIQHVEAQLLQSNLADSTVPGSGIDPLLLVAQPPNLHRPTRRAPPQTKSTGPTPLLVEIKSITEIAHSAFTLLNTHQTRLDRADLGLAHEENAEQPRDEDEGPIPKFPRGMLRFELSDGLTTFRAIEFKSLPQLELGTTPLGYKMLLKSTPIRGGVAYLEPANVVLKGYRTEDHDINSEQVFLSSLRRRLGRPDPPPEAAVVHQPQENPPSPPPPRQPTGQHQAPPAARPQSPPTDYDDMYMDDEVDPDVLRETFMRLDQAIDAQGNQWGPPASISKGKYSISSDTKPALRLDATVASSSLNGPSTPSSIKTSSYFTVHSSEPKPIPNIGLSPRPTSSPDPDFDITWDINDTESSNLLAEEHDTTSTGPPPSAQSRHAIPCEKRATSPDPFDDISFDMEVDESFLEQVGMIEQNALGTGASGKGKGKGKETIAEATTLHNRSREAGKKAPSSSASGTKPLAICRVSPSGAKRNTRIQSSTTRATSTSSLSGSAETPMPQSTQSSGRRLPRDPSLIIISSSDDEAPGGHSMTKPLNLVERRAPKRRAMDQHDVIDISDS